MTSEQLQLFGKLDRQLASLSAEIDKAAGNKADEALGTFKLGLVQRLLAELHAFLGEGLQPFPELAELDTNATLGDAHLLLGQYRACLDEFKARNTRRRYGSDAWVVGEGDEVEYVPVEKASADD